MPGPRDLRRFLGPPPVAEAGPSGALSLRANFMWACSGSAVYSASQWGVLTVLAKAGSPEMVGQFSLALAITAPIVMFTNLQLASVQATDAQHDYSFADYLALRLLTSTVALLVVLVATILSTSSRGIAGVILAIAAAKVLESVSDITYGLFQRCERMDRVGASLMARGPLSLVVLGIVVWTTGSLLYACLALAASWLAWLFLYDLPNARRHARVRPRFDRDRLLRLLSATAPLGVVAMLVSLTTNVPRYYIQAYLGDAQLGYYAGIAYIVTAANTAFLALGQAARPRLARHYAESRVMAFRRLLLRLAGLALFTGLVAVLGSVLLGRSALALLYTKEYSQYASVLIVLLASGAVYWVALLLNDALMAVRLFRAQVPLMLASDIATLLASSVLVPSRGLLGAAEAIAAGRLVHLLLAALLVAYALSRRPRLQASPAPGTSTVGPNAHQA